MQSKKRVLLTRELHEFALKKLEKKYDIKIHHGKIPMPKQKLIREIRNMDGLICFPYDVIDRDVINSARKLLAISTFSVGFDHIDVKYAKSKGITLGYTPEVLTKATADLTISLMLDVMRRISEGDRLIRNGKWKEIFGAHDYVGIDISEKTLGIIGLGRIGSAVAKRASSFDMNIIYHNRTKLSKKKEDELNVKYTTLNELIKKSDVISLHIPDSESTREMVNMEFLKKMKDDAFLVNTSRGKIIKEDDLVSALKQKIIAGAGLDVFFNEPINKSHKLTKMENVVLAPHIGSSTKETREKMAQITIDNLDQGIKGLKPKYSI